MSIARLVAVLILSLASVGLRGLQAADELITLTGKLVRAIAVGGESTGWALELDSAITVDGRQMNSLQVRYEHAAKLQGLANKRVTATGKFLHQQGVETGKHPVLEISSIQELTTETVHPPKAVFSLSGSEWRLEDLGGLPALDNSRATLTFPGAGKVSGNGSCNRFFGPAEIHGHAIKLGPLASSRMACPGPVMSQEAKYLEVLRDAERWEWKDPYLLIYCKGLEKPLRFTRMAAEKPRTPPTKTCHGAGTPR
jgi:heat shock protein HslJ